ncbi:hypothetical protein X768_22865 [Mesorhizobium sp. LSJC265A00]|nr:hypothetical protein X768_22865 [Mesorhizobium sp. LSJC265A00]
MNDAAPHIMAGSGRSGKLKSSTKLFADETTAPVLDPGRGKTKTATLPAVTDHGMAATRRASPMSMRRIERPSARSLISQA